MKRSVFSAILFLAIGMFLTNSAFALTVSPVKLELLGDPGKTLQGEVILLNEEKESKTFYSSFENFEASGESGTPNFVPGKEGLAVWIKSVTQITLAGGQKKTIPFTVEIPKNAEPGGHFAAIFWSTTPPQAGSGQVAVGAKIGSLILLKVSGDVKEGGGLLDFSTKNNQHFFTALPIDFTYRFQNSGNDRVNPSGQIQIKNIFGGVTASFNANKSQGNVLPASVRKFVATWQNDEVKSDASGFFSMVKKEWSHFALGYYTAHLDLTYGNDNKEADSQYGFFIIPWQLLSVILFILLIVASFLFFGVKKYNRWIISKSRGI